MVFNWLRVLGVILNFCPLNDLNIYFEPFDIKTLETCKRIEQIATCYICVKTLLHYKSYFSKDAINESSKCLCFVYEMIFKIKMFSSSSSSSFFIFYILNAAMQRVTKFCVRIHDFYQHKQIYKTLICQMVFLF